MNHPSASSNRVRSLRSLAVATVFLALAATPPAHALPPAHKLPPKMVYIEVASVDTAAMTITVQPKNSMSTDAKTYKVTAATKITVDGRPATLADLKAGQQVHFHLLADGTTADELAASPAPRGSE